MIKITRILIVCSAITFACPIKIVSVDTSNDKTVLRATKAFTDCLGNSHEKNDTFVLDNTKEVLSKMYEAGAMVEKQYILEQYERNAPEKTCLIDPDTKCD